MDENTKKAIIAAVAPLVVSTANGAIVAAASKVITKLTVTNHHEKNITGDSKMNPTENKTAINSAKATAKDNDGCLKKDKVIGADGDLSLQKTDAKVQTADAKALNNGATAVSTLAGGLDTQTDGLNMVF